MLSAFFVIVVRLAEHMFLLQYGQHAGFLIWGGVRAYASSSSSEGKVSGGLEFVCVFFLRGSRVNFVEPQILLKCYFL